MIGKLRPQPIDVTARNIRPSGAMLALTVFGITVMCGWDSRYKLA
jgi:hypothetical protein